MAHNPALWEYPRRRGHLAVKFVAGVGLSTPEVVALCDAYGVEIHREAPSIGLVHLTVENGTEALAKALHDSGLVVYAEPDLVGSPASITPNDSSYGSQYWLSQMNFPNAWGISKGLPGVVIAIIDTGVYVQHPDLAGHVLPGFNFLYNTPFMNDPGSEGHGTLVTGIAAAVTDNSTGVAGAGFNCKFMPLAVRTSDIPIIIDSATYTALAITYAADHGAKVICMSVTLASNPQAVQDAIAYALTKDVLIVAAAGNNNNNAVFYPADNSGVVSVGSVNTNDSRASYSNYGSWITLAAPADQSTGLITTNNVGGYSSTDTGTSLAGPQIAGLGGIIRSANPRLTYSQITSLMTDPANSVATTGFPSNQRRPDAGLVAAAAVAMDGIIYIPTVNTDGLGGVGLTPRAYVESNYPFSILVHVYVDAAGTASGGKRGVPGTVFGRDSFGGAFGRLSLGKFFPITYLSHVGVDSLGNAVAYHLGIDALAGLSISPEAFVDVISPPPPPSGGGANPRFNGITLDTMRSSSGNPIKHPIRLG